MKRANHYFLIKLSLLWLAAASVLHARDDIQKWNWLSLNLWQNDTHKVHTYFDNRLTEDMSEEKLWLASLRHKFQAHKKLQLGLGYTYIDVRNIAADSWTHQQRLEFEVNPKFKLNENWTLLFRNRLELRYIEDRSDVSERFRHRIQVSRPIDLGPFRSYYANAEFFYRFDLETWNEVRTVPVGTSITYFKNTFITAGDSGSIRQSNTIIEANNYSNYTNTYFPAGGASALITANPDNDWANNLVEYALSGQPNDISAEPTRPALRINSAGYAEFEIARNIKLTDIAYSVWWSDDLTDWTQVGLTIEEDSQTMLRVRSTATIDTTANAFFKLVLTQ